MYDYLQRFIYCSLMYSSFYQKVRSCRSFSHTRGTIRKAQKNLHLFQVYGPLEFLAMDILCLFPIIKSRHRFILVVADSYTKMAYVIPLKNTTAIIVATEFLDHCIYPYGVPISLLTNNSPQFTANFFASVCEFLGVNHMTNTAYHPYTNSHTER